MAWREVIDSSVLYVVHSSVWTFSYACIEQTEFYFNIARCHLRARRAFHAARCD